MNDWTRTQRLNDMKAVTARLARQCLERKISLIPPMTDDERAELEEKNRVREAAHKAWLEKISTREGFLEEFTPESSFKNGGFQPRAYLTWDEDAEADSFTSEQLRWIADELDRRNGK